MKVTYQHTYQDGETITLSISVVKGIVLTACVPEVVSEEHVQEYLRWRDEVVLPDLMDNLLPEIVAQMVNKGIDLLGDNE